LFFIEHKTLKNGQCRETVNIEHKTQNKDKQNNNTTKKAKKMSNKCFVFNVDCVSALSILECFVFNVDCVSALSILDKKQTKQSNKNKNKTNQNEYLRLNKNK
jgi:nucleoside phosphorylase